MQPFERLAAWQEAHRLAVAVYRVTDRFPREERYGVTVQMRRAAVSAAANIAEGCVKKGPAEFRRFLDIARGSLSEIAYLLRLASDLRYLTAEQFTELSVQQRRAGFLTWRLYESVSGNRKRRDNSPAA